MTRLPALFCVLAALATPAAAQELAPFFGTYLGRAQVLDAAGNVEEEREMDIVISEGEDDSLVITWTNVSLVDGRRDVPGVERRVDEVTLYPTDRDGIYVEESRGSLFSERDDMEPFEGDPIRWAHIADGRIGMYSAVILEDGQYALQAYERTLTESGMDILFQRIVDGEVVRQITGSAVRVKDQSTITE